MEAGKKADGGRDQERPYIVRERDHMSLLKTEDVARILRKSPWAVRSLVRRGRLHAYRLGHEFRFTQQMVMRSLETHRVR